jgi:hypothetical protein
VQGVPADDTNAAPAVRRASLIRLGTGEFHDAFPIDDVLSDVATDFLARHLHPDPDDA